MDHQQIRDGNDLISSFMGSTIKIDQDDVKDIPLAFLKSPDLKFHQSWKWLMPVVIKIEDHGAVIHIKQNSCSVTIDENTSYQFEGESKMEAVWQAVVAYLEAEQ